MSARAKLQKSMSRRKWGPTRLAEEVGCSQPAISAFLNGRRGVSPELAERISSAVAYEVAPWELVKERPVPRRKEVARAS